MAATAIGGIGIALILTASLAQGVFPSRFVSAIRDWLPGLLMLLVYWQAGQFSAKPAEKLQRQLLTLVEKLIGTLARSHFNPWGRKWLEAYFEFAYLFCYPLIPAGVLALYFTGMRFQLEQSLVAIITLQMRYWGRPSRALFLL